MLPMPIKIHNYALQAFAEITGAKCYLGKVKPLGNAGQWSLDPGAWVSHVSLAGAPRIS